MANPNYPNDPAYRDPNDPIRAHGTSSAFLPAWGWVALAIAAILVFTLIFTWGDVTQQQAEIPTPPATSTTPPPSTPATPPAQSPANPPANQ